MFSCEGLPHTHDFADDIGAVPGESDVGVTHISCFDADDHSTTDLFNTSLIVFLTFHLHALWCQA